MLFNSIITEKVSKTAVKSQIYGESIYTAKRGDIMKENEQLGQSPKIEVDALPEGAVKEKEQLDPLEIALIDLERWDQRLVSLVKNEKIDPWQIDLEVLSQKYIEKLADCLDYRIPARAIATAAILLKMKADAVSWFEEPEDFLFPEGTEMPMLSQPPQRIMRRRITIFELVAALKQAMKPRERRKIFEEEIEPYVEVKPFDMGKYLKEVELRLLEILREGELTFGQLKDQLPLIFLAILHLAHEGKINLVQRGWNQEILIQAA